HAKTKAIQYSRDYIEKVKNVRRNDWDSLVNGRYIFVENAGNLELQETVGGETFGSYTRFLDIEDAYRDTDGNLLDVPGLVDPSTKKITVTVSWIGFRPGTISESMYLTRYMDNLAWTQTTQNHFNAGTHSGTTVLATGGDPIDGEIVLGAGGSADWCEPDLVIDGQALDGNGVAKAVTAIEGRAFVSTGDNASGWTFSNITITDINPPTTSVPGYYNDGGIKGNDVFGEQYYGYVATDTNSKEVIIIDISNTPYSEVGYFDIPSNTDGESVFVYGNTGYVAEEQKLWNFNLDSKTGERLKRDLDGVSLSGEGKAVYVVGDYAYVATEGTKRLQIFDVGTDPINMTEVGWATLDSADAQDVFVNTTGTRAYVVTASSSTKREFFIVNIEQKTGEQPVIGNYDTNGMDPRGVEVVPGGRAIVVGTGGVGIEEYQVVNISNETSLVRCGGMDLTFNIFDSASVLEADNDAYTYIVTGDASEEFQIIEGGPGGNYSSSGTFESQTLDTGFNSTGFNRFVVNENEPVGTSVRYQVAAKEPEAGGCSVTAFSIFDFVGPTGDASSFFNGDDFVPTNNDGSGYENPSQCFRFRAYLETNDFVRTPTFYDFTLNYSP
ncbi:MAG: hypothetical protein NUV98_03990, partial [Candidatus Roizmanbacteria bacterium]|nr:hypothetical protein [Candidatus Roizmanbacteria bacterium]